MTKFFSDREIKMICKPLEARGFVVEFDDEKQIVTASKHRRSIKMEYSFYRALFGVPVSVADKD